MKSHLKYASFLSLLIVFNVFLFFSCSNLFNENFSEGKIMLKLPSASSRAAADLESLEFKIELENLENQKKDTKKAVPGEAIDFEVSPGLYNVFVYSYKPENPEEVLYEGEANNVEVNPGKTTNVSITLKKLGKIWTLDLNQILKIIKFCLV